MNPKDPPDSKRFTKEEARAALPEELRVVYDELCSDTIAWSQFIYGKQMISYSIVMRLVEEGWVKRKP